MISTCSGAKKRNFFDDFETDFDSRSDNYDDNNVREFSFVVDQHIISDQFDDKTSGDECSVMGDNSAAIYYIYIGLILIFLISNSTSDADSNPPLCILTRTRW